MSLCAINMCQKASPHLMVNIDLFCTFGLANYSNSKVSLKFITGMVDLSDTGQPLVV